MTNAELIKGLRWCADESICCDDFSGEKCPYFDEKKDSCSVDEILHAAADALEKTVPREWWLMMRAYIADLAENNKDVPRNRPYYDYAVFLLRLMDMIEADSNPASKLVVPKFKQITADSLADMCEGVVLVEDANAATDVIEWEGKR